MQDQAQQPRQPSPGAIVYQQYRSAVRHEPPAPPPRPWLLSGVAVACAVAVVVGSLGPWLYRESTSRTLGTFDIDLLKGW